MAGTLAQVMVRVLFFDEQACEILRRRYGYGSDYRYNP